MPGRLRLSSVEACERQAWSLLVWPTEPAGSPGVNENRIRPFLCGSWRCRRCARWRGAVDWSRCAAGITGRDWWTYCVLTLDPQDFADPWDAYRTVGYLWDHKLRRRLERTYGRFEYLQTWERHTRAGSEWPHLNLMIRSPAMRDRVLVAGERTVWRRADSGGQRRCRYSPGFRQDLLAAAVGSGFGAGHFWCETVTQGSGDAMAGYLVKLARELTGASSKGGDQSPLLCPKGFRRIRASRGLLPARRKGTGFTGTLVPFAAFAMLDGAMNGMLDRGPRKPGERQTGLPVSDAVRDDLLEQTAKQIAGEWQLDPGRVRFRQVDWRNLSGDRPTPLQVAQRDDRLDYQEQAAPEFFWTGESWG